MTKPKPSNPRAPERASDAAASDRGERIAKRIARSGLCSRRDAERWIAEGRVAVDGTVLTSPAFLVTATSRIMVNGQVLPASEATRLWRYHKPRGLVTTHRDPEARPTVFNHLPAGLPRVISIGRLDFNSEGLLLLTNDGALARRLELPATGWLRRYRVRVNGTIDPDRLARLADGIEIDGVRYGAIQATLDSVKGRNAWLTMSLREGKNREVRRVVEALGGIVNRLIRVAYGPFQLGYIEPGAVEEVPPRVLRDQLGSGGGPDEEARPDKRPDKRPAKRAAKPGQKTVEKPAAKRPGKPPERARRGPGHAHRQR